MLIEVRRTRWRGTRGHVVTRLHSRAVVPIRAFSIHALQTDNNLLNQEVRSATRLTPKTAQIMMNTKKSSGESSRHQLCSSVEQVFIDRVPPSALAWRSVQLLHLCVVCEDKSYVNAGWDVSPHSAYLHLRRMCCMPSNWQSQTHDVRFPMPQ